MENDGERSTGNDKMEELHRKGHNLTGNDVFVNLDLYANLYILYIIWKLWAIFLGYSQSQEMVEVS